MTLAIPTVHLNGTSRDELVSQVSGAHEAVCKAILKLREASPNGRDYYVTGTISKAMDEHAARLTHLETVAGELETIWQGISDQ